MHWNIRLIKLLLQVALFVSLFMIFFFCYCTEVIQKFANDYTNVVISQENLLEGAKPPFLTVCVNPAAKDHILEKYNFSAMVLNEPNFHERKILSDLNKTIEAVFREATYKLDQDFQLFITLWVYNNSGWDYKKQRMNESDSNFIQVMLQFLPLFDERPSV